MSVPNAAAATACAPPILKTCLTPAISAATSVAQSTVPSSSGGVNITGVFTPAMTAGIEVIIATLGKEPFPLGTYKATDSIGRFFSPANTPGCISIIHSFFGI